MTNNLVLPLLALVLAVLAAFLPSGGEDQPPGALKDRMREIRSGTFLTAIVILLFTAAVAVWPTTFEDGSSTAIALALGALAGVFSAGAGVSRRGFAFGMAVFGAGMLHLLPEAAIATSQIAFVTGAFVAAFTTGGLWSNLDGGYLCAFGAVFVVAGDFLGRIKSGSDVASHAGGALGVAFLVSALLSGVFSRISASALVRGGVGFIALLLIGYLACWKFLLSGSQGQLWVGGVIVGGIVHLLLAGETQQSSFRSILATVIWLGAATVAFGMNLGYGMAVTLLGGASALILLGNVRGLMSMGVVAAILIYRLFREMYPEDAKALDIGQHYTMIGIAIGALLPLLPLEWSRSFTDENRLTGWRAFGALKVWTIILLGIPVAAAVLLGSKGAIGMVVGLSFAAVIEGIRGTVNLAPVGIATGMGCLTVLSYGWLGDWTDLDRGVKLHAVIVVAAVACVLSAALWALSPKKALQLEAK